jgi:plasmid maintenance system antidote protein VapI
MKLGELLSGYMRDHQLSTRQLAAQIGCNHTTIHRMLHGQSVRLHILLLLIAWLLSDQKPEKGTL